MSKTTSERFCLEKLYSDHFTMLYRLACNQLNRYIGSTTDASDMVQDVYLLAASNAKAHKLSTFKIQRYGVRYMLCRQTYVEKSLLTMSVI